MRHRDPIPTFAAYERTIDGRGGYVPPPDACADCGGVDRDHERWCPQIRGVQVGAEYIARRNRMEAA